MVSPKNNFSLTFEIKKNEKKKENFWQHCLPIFRYLPMKFMFVSFSTYQKKKRHTQKTKQETKLENVNRSDDKSMTHMNLCDKKRYTCWNAFKMNKIICILIHGAIIITITVIKLNEEREQKKKTHTPT